MKAKVYQRRDRKGTRFYVYLYHGGRKLKRYHDIDGQPFKAKYRAERLAERINSELETEGKNFNAAKWFGSNNSLAFNTYVAAWMERKADTDLSPLYLSQLQGVIKNHWLPFFSDTDLREIRAAHIQDFYATLKELGDSTRRFIMVTLKNVFKEAYQREEIFRVPPFPTVKVMEPETEWLNEEQRAQVLEFINPADRPIFEFGIYYGLRPCMSRALMWDCIDFEKKEIVIKRSFSGSVLREKTKNNRILPLPLMPEAEAILKPIRGISGFVFRTRRGVPYQAQWFGKIWRRANKKANEKYGTPIVEPYQGVKHSTGMQKLREGWTPEQLQKLFGHRKLESTLRYARTDTEMLRAKLTEAKSGGANGG